MLISASNQVSMSDFDAGIHELSVNKSDQLFSLINQFTNMNDIIPASFYNDYYSDLSKNRDFPLDGMLKALVFYNMLGLPTVSTLIFIISISSDFRKFLCFLRSPHPSQFSKFKLLFYDVILETFHRLVDFTSDFTSDFAIDADEALANILITDTTGFELYVKEQLLSSTLLSRSTFLKSINR